VEREKKRKTKWVSHVVHSEEEDPKTN
jgi:hypothetical protein